MSDKWSLRQISIHTWGTLVSGSNFYFIKAQLTNILYFLSFLLNGGLRPLSKWLYLAEKMVFVGMGFVCGFLPRKGE
jgi:hypothetical protein